MKTIALNGLLLNNQLGGVGTYIRTLDSYLQKVEKNYRLVLFLNKHRAKSYPSNNDVVGINIPVNNPVIRILMEGFIWPLVLKKHNIDLFHSPISYLPPGVSIPAIITIHDLRYFHFPETYLKLRGKFLQKRIPYSAHKAKKIISVSNTTRQDIIKYCGVSAEKISVIYEGIEKSKFEKEYTKVEWNKIKQHYNLPETYIFTVGHLEPRKNYQRLLQAYRILLDSIHPVIPLVICGRENWYFQDIYTLVKQLGLEHKVRFTGFVNDTDLSALYQHARLFVAPSIFEGFGFTPLESMAAGVPVAASDVTSFPEILGDAALYFDPFDPKDMASKMKTLLQNKSQADVFVHRGLKNIERFRWDECCQKTLAVYRTVLEEI